jgi:hypothetical protein
VSGTMTESSRIISRPREDTTSESSRAAIARCYAYLVKRRGLLEQREGGPATAPDNARAESNQVSRRTSHVAEYEVECALEGLSLEGEVLA